MFKKVLVLVLAFVLLFNSAFPFSPVATAYAFSSYKVEVTKNNAPIRKGYYETKDVVKKCPKGTILTVTGEKRNLYGNLWYKVKDGYIYSGNVKKVKEEHKCSYKLVRYGVLHPHYAEYECSCGSGYCTMETKKVDGCKECYPHECSYKFVRYGKTHPHLAEYECSCGSGYCTSETKKVDSCSECNPHKCSYKITRYGKEHPHYAEYKCSCGNGYCGIETKKIDSCEKCSPHKCSYKFVTYGLEHPHYAEYACLCGNGYCTMETGKKDGCRKCNEKDEDVHVHNYHLVRYGQTHPHYAEYECSCGSGYCGTETGHNNDCGKCNPVTHSCWYVSTGKYSTVHPHGLIEICSGCGKTRVNLINTNYVESCNICNSPFANTNFGEFPKYPSLSGKVFNFNNRQVYNLASPSMQDYANDLHTTLDLCGFVPGPTGMVCDGVNVLFYLIEADWLNAGISAVAFVPFVGIVSSSGKLVNKTGTLIIDAAASTVDDALQVTTKTFIVNGDVVSDISKQIVKNSAKYSDDVLETIAKISRNESVNVAEAFYDGQLLISREYGGTVISRAGLKYTTGSAEGHRIYHIIERHGANTVSASHGTLFNVDGEAIFDIIDDAVVNGNIVGIPVLQDNGNYKTIYQTYRQIGKNGETKLQVISNGKGIVTAYPVK